MSSPKGQDREWFLQGALLASGLFILYAWGACRTIYVGDSGELVTAAAILGIPHPSGYPLYVLLGHLWITLLPFGTIAFRMSLFSAFFAASSCGLLYLTARRQGSSPWGALLGSLLLAFSPSFWSQANVQRVYSLNAFFVVALLACALEWYRRRDIRWMVLAAFVAGLGACNHTVMGVLGLAVGCCALLAQPSLLRRPFHLMACVGAGFAGLTPYAYLPLRSRQDPALDWGNPESWQSFIAVVARKDFWHRAWAETPGDYVTIASDYLRSLGHESLWLGAGLALLAVLGRGFDKQHHWSVGLPVAIMLANFWIVAVHGSRSDIFIWHRYYIPSYVMLAWLAMQGYQWLEGRRHGAGRRRLRAGLLLPVALLLLGWSTFDRSDYTLADEFSRTLLTDLPPGARLAASDDNILFVLMYLKFAEGLRPDVDLILQGVGGADLPNLRFDPDRDPLYFTHHPNWNFPQLDMVPVGLVFRTSRRGAPPPELWLEKAELQGAWDPDVPKDYLSRNLVGHFHYMRALSYESNDWPEAQREFQKAALAAFDNDVLFYNLGLIYRRNGLLERSLAAFERSAEINPRHIPSANPTRPRDRVREVRRQLAARRALEARVLEHLGMSAPTNAEQHRRLAIALADGSATAQSMAEMQAAAHGHRLLAQELEAGLWTAPADDDPKAKRAPASAP